MDERTFDSVVCKAIPGFPGYWAGEDGHIRSTRSPSPFMKTWNGFTTLKPHVGRYASVSVTGTNGKQVRHNSHRLVLLAWVGACPPGMEALHKNGNALDNRPSNLRWATHSENEADKKFHGTSACGERQARSKLSDYYAAKIRAAYDGRRGTIAEFARTLGVDRSCVSAVVNCKTFKHLIPERV